MSLHAVLAPAWQIIRHDQRLLWREMHRGEMGWLRSWLPLGVLFSILQTMALLFAWQLKSPPPPGALTAAWGFLVVVALGGVMNRALVLLYEKGDLDLLLASPLSASTVLLGRLGSIAAAAWLFTSIFVLPMLNALLLRFGPAHLAGWLVWVLLILAAAAAGTGAMLTLVRWLGLRRGKLAAQLLAVALSLAPMAAIMAPALAAKSQQPALQQFLSRLLQHPAWTLVGRASQGDPLALGLLAGLTALLVAATAWLLARTFVTGAQQVAERPSSGRRREHTWTEGLAPVIFRKELRLLARHPLTLSQLLPVTLLIFGMGGVGIHLSHDLRLLASFALYWCGFGPLQLAIFAAAGEIGWDLVRQSGVPTSRVRRLKVVACLILTLGPTLPFLAWLALAGQPGLAALTVAVAAVCGSTVAWLGVTTTRPSPRPDVITPPKGRSLLLQMVAVALGMTSAAGVTLIGYGQAGFGVFFLAVVLLGVLACFTLVDPEPAEAAG